MPPINRDSSDSAEKAVSQPGATPNHNAQPPTVDVSSLQLRALAPAEAPMNLLLEADPSTAMIQTYLSDCLIWGAELQKDAKPTVMIGVCAIQMQSAQQAELMNIAIEPAFQNQGLGSVFLQKIMETMKLQGIRYLELGTGTFGHQLTFYQRAGFRVIAVEPDYFLRHYPTPLFENGLQHKDRLRLRCELQRHKLATVPTL